MNPHRLSGWSIAMILLIGCSATRQSPSGNSSSQPVVLDRVIVVSDFDDPRLVDSFEPRLAGILQDQGVRAVPAMQFVSAWSISRMQSVKEVCADSGIDAYLVITVDSGRTTAIREPVISKGRYDRPRDHPAWMPTPFPLQDERSLPKGGNLLSRSWPDLRATLMQAGAETPVWTGVSRRNTDSFASLETMITSDCRSLASLLTGDPHVQFKK